MVVGDIVPIFFGWLSRKKLYVYLVAYSSHYEGKLRLPWPCKFFLNSKKVLKIYSRDNLTAIDLTIQLNKKVNFFGNPFMDKFALFRKTAKNYLFNILFKFF